MPVYDIRPFNIRAASDAEYTALVELKNIIQHEYLPDDPPTPRAEAVKTWQALPGYIENVGWAAWDEAHSRMAAYGDCEISYTGDNQHEMDFRIEVLPECRRQGLARRLLRLLVEQARTWNRRLMITQVVGAMPAGDAFLAGMGARQGLEARQSELRLTELDRDMLAAWLERGRRLSGEFCLGWWDERYPEERMQQLADMMQIVGNDQPRDTLDLEDFNFTPDILRQFETMLLAGGQQRWTAYATDRQTDRVVGVTEVLWHPDRPAILQQAFTGILPEIRCRGLGRWLKAEMLDRVLRERPQVKVVRTGNANSNAPMLKINIELGYKPFFSIRVWQVDRPAVEQYLAARAS